MKLSIGVVFLKQCLPYCFVVVIFSNGKIPPADLSQPCTFIHLYICPPSSGRRDRPHAAAQTAVETIRTTWGKGPDPAGHAAHVDLTHVLHSFSNNTRYIRYTCLFTVYSMNIYTFLPELDMCVLICPVWMWCVLMDPLGHLSVCFCLIWKSWRLHESLNHEDDLAVRYHGYWNHHEAQKW